MSAGRDQPRPSASPETPAGGTPRAGAPGAKLPPRRRPPSGLDLAAVAQSGLESFHEDLDVPAPAPPPEPAPAWQAVEFGPYQLLERVAVGGMAEVFRAKRAGVEGFEKVVAVKRILPHLSDNEEFVEMFVHEAKVVAGLAHPNIVQIFDLGRIGRSYYIAMEYVHGHDLRSIEQRAREKSLRLPIDLEPARGEPGLRGARLRPPQARRARAADGDRAPRREPAEHPDLVRGRREARRLRDREGRHQGGPPVGQRRYCAASSCT